MADGDAHAHMKQDIISDCIILLITISAPVLRQLIAAAMVIKYVIRQLPIILLMDAIQRLTPAPISQLIYQTRLKILWTMQMMIAETCSAQTR